MTNVPSGRIPADPEEESILEVVRQETGHRDGSAHLNLGQPLPTRYGVDRIRIMIQSPFRVFVYWEVAPATLAKALSAYPPEDRAHFQLIFRWFELGKAALGWFDAGAISFFWIDTAPLKQYQAQLCLYSDNYGIVPVLTSQFTSTPRYSPEEIEIVEEVKNPLLADLLQWAGVGQFKESSPVVLPETERAIEGALDQTTDYAPSSSAPAGLARPQPAPEVSPDLTRLPSSPTKPGRF